MRACVRACVRTWDWWPCVWWVSVFNCTFAPVMLHVVSMLFQLQEINNEVVTVPIGRN